MARLRWTMHVLGASLAAAGFAVVTAAPARLNAAPPQAQQPATAEQKPAEQVYKNIHALTGVPADQVLPSMQYITVALGVQCNFCHVPNQFEKDDKQEKLTARQMIQMTLAINKESFSGRREVSCYTCHRGAAKPVSVPLIAGVTGTPVPTPLPASTANPAPAPGAAPAVPATPLPTADQVLEKYVQALGGAEAIQKITSREMKGTFAFTGGFHAPLEDYSKAPDKEVTILHTPNGDFLEGYDGTVAWEKNPRGQVRELAGDELALMKKSSEFYRDLHLNRGYSRFQVRGVEKVGDRDAYVVLAFPSGNRPERYYFDVQTGLLLRWIFSTDSFLGSIPRAADYEDYRDVDGVKVPFTLRTSRPEGVVLVKFDQIQSNVAVEDARFEKPAEQPAARPAKP